MQVTPTTVSTRPSFAATIKEATSDLHVTAERHPFQQRLLKGQVTRDELAAYLHELSHLYRQLEEALDASSHAAIRSLYREHHCRARLAKQDVLALDGLYGDTARTRAARSFSDAISDLTQADPVALIGVLYVLEGSSNGNVYLARALERSLGLQPGVATTSLDPHGPDQRPRWQAFRGGLDQLGLTEEENRRIIAAARSTFRAIHDIADELAPARI